MDIINQAIKLIESNHNEQAIELLNEFLPTATEDERFLIAELYMQWGYFNEASTLLKALLTQFPDEGELNILLADIYIELENDDEAIALLNEINKDDPVYLQSLLQLADLYQAQGLFEVAERKLLEAKQIDPDEQVIDLALGEFLFSLGEYKRAIVFYERIISKTAELADISIYFRLAESHAAIGEYKEALHFFEKVKSDNPDVLFKQALTAFYAKENKVAIQIWEKVLEFDEAYHTVYYYLAKAYREEGLIQKAFDTVTKGIKVDEFNKELYYFAGLLAHQLDNNDESERLIREAIILDPDYKQAVLFLVELLKEHDNHHEIVDLITEIKTMKATDPLYEWELAKAYNEVEAYDKALKHYQEAYNSLSYDSDFLLEYGYYLTEEGLLDQAISIFQSYLAIEPQDLDTEQYVKRLMNSDSNYH